MTSLVLYGVESASATLSTANKLVTSTGGTGDVTKTSKLGTATGYGQLYSQGNTGAWAAGGSIPAPNGHGFLFDSTLLENQTISSGTWTVVWHNRIGAGSIVTDMYLAAYVRSSGGAYTSIGTVLLSAQSVTNTAANFTLTGSLPAQAFGVGDKLYLEDFYNVTTNGNGNVNLIAAIGQSSTANGIANYMQVTTPGYTVSGSTSTRTVPMTAVLQTTLTRTIPMTAVLQQTKRIIPMTAVLTNTATRTIPMTATLSGIIDVSAEQSVINARIGFMSPSIIRTTAPNCSVWCPSGIAGTYDFTPTNPLFTQWLTIFDQAQAISATVIVSMGSPGPFSLLSSSWCTAFSDLINYLIFSLGYTNISYVSLSQPDTLGASYSDYKNTIEPNLITALNANNLLNYVSLIGPDTASAADDSWVTNSAGDLSSTLGGYARQDSPQNATDISSNAMKDAATTLLNTVYAADGTNKPVFQTSMDFGYMGPGAGVTTYQYGVELADYCIQLLRAGIAAPIAYILDDEMHQTEWGMWDSLDGTDILRPWFFVWSLLCQILDGGSTLYAPTQPTSKDFRCLIAQNAEGNWAIVLVNRRTARQSLQISIPQATPVQVQLQAYIYSQDAPLLVDSNGFPLPSWTYNAVLSRTFSTSMAANSVLILTQPVTVTNTVYDVKKPVLQKRR